MPVLRVCPAYVGAIAQSWVKFGVWLVIFGGPGILWKPEARKNARNLAKHRMA